MAIVVLILWFATAGAGLTLLRAGGSARRRQDGRATPVPGPLAAAVASVPGVEPRPAVDTGLPASPLAGSSQAVSAVPMTADGKPPPGPHVRIATPAGEHPLLEFSHPTLAIAGIACWMMFTFVHYRPMAWVAVAILSATALAGLAWLLRNWQDGRRQAAGAWPFPGKLIALHGAVAGSSLLLSVLAAVTAAHG